MNGEQVADELAKLVADARDATSGGRYQAAADAIVDLLTNELATILRHLRAQSPEAVEKIVRHFVSNERWSIGKDCANLVLEQMDEWAGAGRPTEGYEVRPAAEAMMAALRAAVTP